MTDSPESSDRSPPSPPHSPAHQPDTLKNVTALARFEFEPGGLGNAGTKVMMVEWQDDAADSRDKSGKWQVSWPGKKTVFPADDELAKDGIRRLYFLLPPGQTVPPSVTLSYHAPPRGKEGQGKDIEGETGSPKMSIPCLPAIFTPELGATAKTSGKKGVLHTIWAKKRLQVLDKEIKYEEEHNLEGIALEMARAEKSWIETNFGLLPQQKPPGLDLGGIPKGISGPVSPGIQSPKSPGGRRLSEKLKGLSIGTTEKDLNARGGAINTPTREAHPLSPEASDVAYSSFGAFRNGPISAASAGGAKKIVAQQVPESIRRQQEQGGQAQAGVSMNAVAAGQSQKASQEDDLFAVALSPRSPDGPKSPFSISSAEAGAFARIKGESGSSGSGERGAFSRIKGER
jgi:hypothetical protein